MLARLPPLVRLRGCRRQETRSGGESSKTGSTRHAHLTTFARCEIIRFVWYRTWLPGAQWPIEKPLFVFPAFRGAHESPPLQGRRCGLRSPAPVAAEMLATFAFGADAREAPI